MISVYMDFFLKVYYIDICGEFKAHVYLQQNIQNIFKHFFSQRNRRQNNDINKSMD